MTQIAVPVSHGELIDKLTILEIKSERIVDPAKLTNIHNELDALNRAWQGDPAAAIDIADPRCRLKAINQTLWDIEDEIRIKEKAHAFDERFIELARAVYVTNDQRADVKREINERLGSTLVEEKSYQPYR